MSKDNDSHDQYKEFKLFKQMSNEDNNTNYQGNFSTLQNSASNHILKNNSSHFFKNNDFNKITLDININNNTKHIEPTNYINSNRARSIFD